MYVMASKCFLQCSHFLSVYILMFCLLCSIGAHGTEGFCALLSKFSWVEVTNLWSSLPMSSGEFIETGEGNNEIQLSLFKIYSYRERLFSGMTFATYFPTSLNYYSCLVKGLSSLETYIGQGKVY